MARVYGIHAVESLLRENASAVGSLWLQRGRGDQRRVALASLARTQDVAVTWVTRAELDKLVQGRHQGAVAETADVADEAGRAPDILWREADLMAAIEAASVAPLILVLDGVTDPHNLGACLRSADAAGVLAVVAPKDNAVGMTPVVRKVACGAAETVPFVQVTNLSRTLASLKERGVWLYGADADAGASLYDTDLRGAVALVLGAEGSGLRRLTRESCDFLVSLPMAGAVSSLNVSVAAGVCLFEVVRQRQRG
ncbi:MAG: 23S rRNA (guanosine(2251)-2'-O)-methyltransferase RlmB [Halioglobus sp.]